MRFPIAVAALVVLVIGLTPAGLSQPAEVLFTAQGGDDCPRDQSYCFGVVGDLAAIEPGQELTVTLENRGGTVHNLYVLLLEEADPGAGSTRSSQAMAGTGEALSPGQRETFTVTVPDDGRGLYFWCDVTGHERLGMWVAVDLVNDTVEGAVEPAPADGQRGAPALAPMVTLALLGAAALLRRRG